MPFTAQQLANIGSAALDFHMRGQPESQTIQAKPLLAKLKKYQKTFPGGKEFITVPVKGDYTTTIQGYTHDDTVTYANPANMKRASYKWYEIHWGIQITGTELKIDGISVVDSLTGEKKSQHSQREMTALSNILEDKLEDMTEGGERGMNEMFWRDGTQDAKQAPGILSFITETPSTGTTGGIDRVANDWWRNRAIVNLSTTTPSDMAIAQALGDEYRQLRRYGGDPNTWLAGSDFIEAMEDELRAKGTVTNTGWAVSKDGKNARLEASMADISFKGNLIEYDPTLDDLGYADALFVLDLKNGIKWMPMEGEDMKQHAPARPTDKYVYFQAVTTTGGMIAKRLNSSGIYRLA